MSNATTTNNTALYTDHGQDFNAKGMWFNATEITLAPISDRAKEFWKRIGGGESISATFAKTGGYDLIAQFESEGMTLHAIPVFRLAIPSID